MTLFGMLLQTISMVLVQNLLIKIHFKSMVVPRLRIRPLSSNIEQVRSIGKIAFILWIITIHGYGCTSNSTETQEGSINGIETSRSCFDVPSNIIDRKRGCPGFLLFKQIPNQMNHVLIIKGNREKFQSDTCYKIIVDQAEYYGPTFQIYLDLYTPGSIHRTYCGDIEIVNAETPRRANCVSGFVRCHIRSIGVGREVISLELSNAVFVHEDEEITINKILFENVLITDWAG